MKIPEKKATEFIKNLSKAGIELTPEGKEDLLNEAQAIYDKGNKIQMSVSLIRALGSLGLAGPQDKDVKAVCVDFLRQDQPSSNKSEFQYLMVVVTNLNYKRPNEPLKGVCAQMGLVIDDSEFAKIEEFYNKVQNTLDGRAMPMTLKAACIRMLTKDNMPFTQLVSSFHVTESSVSKAMAIISNSGVTVPEVKIQFTHTKKRKEHIEEDRPAKAAKPADHCEALNANSFFQGATTGKIPVHTLLNSKKEQENENNTPEGPKSS